MFNEDVRLEIARSKLQKRNIAAELGITPHAFSHWLNGSELPNWKKTLIYEAIERVAEEQKGAAV